VTITRSSANDIRRLVAELASGDVDRSAAIARLTIIGTRAVEPLMTLAAGDAERSVRVGALQALEGIRDSRILPAVLALVESADVPVAAAALSVVRACLEAASATQSTVALDRLTATALDVSRQDAVRLVAVDALRSAPGRPFGSILEQLRNDPSAAVRARALAPDDPSRAVDPAVALRDEAYDRASNDPFTVRRLVETTARCAPLPTLHRLIGTIRARESARRSTEGRSQWRAVRGDVHAALAARRSRVALYDLRETFAEADEPIPSTFVAAVGAIGDSTCLEPIAHAHARAVGDALNDWRWQLVEAFLAIVRREKLTRRHGTLRRALARSPRLAASVPPRF
jgi:hypothetical protein